MTDFAQALKLLWPHGDEKVPGLREGIITSAPAAFAKYQITSPLVLAHLMAQISHEAGAGHEIVENLNYSAGRMMQVWPSRFPTMGVAAPYANNPRALANNVYGSRMGNRPGTNDGWNFRGRGATQTTGYDGYRALAAKTGLDLVNNPDIVNDPAHFLECGIADFILCGCMPFALNDDIAMVTRKLNGGYTGLEQRKQWFAKWQAMNVPVPTYVAVHPAPTDAPPAPVDAPSIPIPPVLPPPRPRPPVSAPAPAPKPSWIASLIAAIVSMFKKR